MLTQAQFGTLIPPCGTDHSSRVLLYIVVLFVFLSFAYPLTTENVSIPSRDCINFLFLQFNP